MNVSLTLLDEDFKKIDGFMKLSMNAVPGRTLVLSPIDGSPLTIARIKVDGEEGGIIHTVFIYCNTARLLASIHEQTDYTRFVCEYDTTFEIRHTPSRDTYYLTKGYDEIKMGMSYVYCYSKKNAEAINELFKLIREMEKDDLGEVKDA